MAPGSSSRSCVSRLSPKVGVELLTLQGGRVAVTQLVQTRGLRLRPLGRCAKFRTRCAKPWVVVPCSARTSLCICLTKMRANGPKRELKLFVENSTYYRKSDESFRGFCPIFSKSTRVRNAVGASKCVLIPHVCQSLPCDRCWALGCRPGKQTAA